MHVSSLCEMHAKLRHHIISRGGEKWRGSDSRSSEFERSEMYAQMQTLPMHQFNAESDDF